MLTPEQRFLIRLSNPALPPGQAGDLVATLLSTYPEPDYHDLYEKVQRNGVAGFFHENLRTIDRIPEEFRELLKSAHRHTTIQNLDRVSEIIRVISMLQEHDISVIPLKGVVAAETLFDNLGIYPSGDIDILVRPTDLEHAHDVLTCHGGYSSPAEYSRSDQLENSYHLVYQREHYWLEVHWNLTMRYYSTPPEHWWADTRSSSWRGLEITYLSPENYLLYTLFRLFVHAYYPLRFWALVAGIINHHSESIRWDMLMQQAAGFKMQRMVTFTLALLDEFWDLGIPAEITGRKIGGFGTLKRMVLDSIFSGDGRRHARMLGYTTLLDSPQDFVRVLGRRIIPSGAELRMRYKLPPGSAKIMLYYVLNPFYLLFKKYKR